MDKVISNVFQKARKKSGKMSIYLTTKKNLNQIQQTHLKFPVGNQRIHYRNIIQKLRKRMKTCLSKKFTQLTTHKN